MSSGRDARRLATCAIAAAVALFAALVVVLPAFGLEYDEARYLSMGANIWAGRGPVTAFGDVFLLHSPVWMTVLYAPRALLGVDPVAWGHVINLAGGIGVVALVGIMGRRISPAAGVVAAFAMLAFGYLLLLTRTTRLDVPEAALALLYLEVGWRAARSGSARWAIAAGAAFALATLVKEVAIPLAPVPFLVAVLAGIPWRRLLRTSGWMAIAASIGLAPWFLYIAARSGIVYRVGTPAWTLPILFAPVLAMIVLGLAAGSLAGLPSIAGASERLRHRLPARITAHGRALVGWGLTLAWSAAFLFFFARIGRLKGAPLVQIAQLRHYLGMWALDIVPVGLFCLSGLVLALALLVRDRGAPERRGVTNALVAAACGAPIVVMVIALGEPPRDYIAVVAAAVAVAAGGWTWAIGRLIVRLASEGRRSGLARWGMAATVAVAMVVGSAALGGRAWLTRAGTDAAPTQVTRATVDWIRAHVPPGTPIAFGSYLSYEMAYQLVADYPTYQALARVVSVDPAAPMAFRRPGEAPSTDWIAADAAPRSLNEYGAFRAAWLMSDMTSHRIAYWVYATGSDTASPAILAQLTPAHGFDPVASWAFVSHAGATYRATIFRVGLDRLSLDTAHLYLSATTLNRLVTKLAATPAASRVAAAALLPRIVVDPSSSAADADLARLRALAGP